jgi:UDP-N-acetylmuramoylalanine--D-glutamate ligase
MMTQRVGILGLGRSGRAAARLALARGGEVYASDAGDGVELREAAESIRREGGVAQTGGHSTELLAECDLIIISPGIPPTAPVLQDERLRHVPRVSELEFAFRALGSRVIGITGTNGKSTTTALTSHILEVHGIDAPAAGNIGVALSEVALRQPQPDWVVVEASSFQLGAVDTFAPDVGVLTNLSPDHLDRYADTGAYYADKKHLFDHARSSSTWVLNAEDAAVLALAGDAPGARLYFRVASQPPAGEQGAYVRGDAELVLVHGSTETLLAHTAELKLMGRHNHANALAAALCASAVGVPTDAIAEGLRTFAGLEHRLEIVGEHDGVRWVNDSKATNVGSARVALESMDRPVILLLGGRPKNEPFAELVRGLESRVARVLAFGEAAATIERELGAYVVVERLGTDFDAVVQRASEVAEPGQAVLLSPACASFDMFRDYEDRGYRFKAAVMALSGVRHG